MANDEHLATLYFYQTNKATPKATPKDTSGVPVVVYLNDLSDNAPFKLSVADVDASESPIDAARFPLTSKMQQHQKLAPFDSIVINNSDSSPLALMTTALACGERLQSDYYAPSSLWVWEKAGLAPPSAPWKVWPGSFTPFTSRLHESGMTSLFIRGAAYLFIAGGVRRLRTECTACYYGGSTPDKYVKVWKLDQTNSAFSPPVAIIMSPEAAQLKNARRDFVFIGLNNTYEREYIKNLTHPILIAAGGVDTPNWEYCINPYDPSGSTSSSLAGSEKKGWQIGPSGGIINKHCVGASFLHHISDGNKIQRSAYAFIIGGLDASGATKRVIRLDPTNKGENMVVASNNRLQLNDLRAGGPGQTHFAATTVNLGCPHYDTIIVTGGTADDSDTPFAEYLSSYTFKSPSSSDAAWTSIVNPHLHGVIRKWPYYTFFAMANEAPVGKQRCHLECCFNTDLSRCVIPINHNLCGYGTLCNVPTSTGHCNKCDASGTCTICDASTNDYYYCLNEPGDQCVKQIGCVLCNPSNNGKCKHCGENYCLGSDGTCHPSKGCKAGNTCDANNACTQCDTSGSRPCLNPKKKCEAAETAYPGCASCSGGATPGTTCTMCASNSVKCFDGSGGCTGSLDKNCATCSTTTKDYCMTCKKKDGRDNIVCPSGVDGSGSGLSCVSQPDCTACNGATPPNGKCTACMVDNCLGPSDGTCHAATGCEADNTCNHHNQCTKCAKIYCMEPHGVCEKTKTVLKKNPVTLAGCLECSRSLPTTCIQCNCSKGAACYCGQQIADVKGHVALTCTKFPHCTACEDVSEQKAKCGKCQGSGLSYPSDYASTAQQHYYRNPTTGECEEACATAAMAAGTVNCKCSQAYNTAMASGWDTTPARDYVIGGGRHGIMRPLQDAITGAGMSPPSYSNDGRCYGTGTADHLHTCGNPPGFMRHGCCYVACGPSQIDGKYVAAGTPGQAKEVCKIHTGAMGCAADVWSARKKISDQLKGDFCCSRNQFSQPCYNWQTTHGIIDRKCCSCDDEWNNCAKSSSC